MSRLRNGEAAARRSQAADGGAVRPDWEQGLCGARAIVLVAAAGSGTPEADRLGRQKERSMAWAVQACWEPPVASTGNWWRHLSARGSGGRQKWAPAWAWGCTRRAKRCNCSPLCADSFQHLRMVVGS
ncbi:hypothetical protein NDU88_003636 [Pleurodeles waltl]|uniref:Uncharacterized protein n=1 Tax=Pleurodeles waltl TaxID=8319 RepID=A0AAV7W2R2_PLEWA|nr:hypothetical protein NDU88_003636 [Pleurodeles waltl]